MTELSPRARSLIASANGAERVDVEARVRGAQRLQRHLAAAGAVGATSLGVGVTKGAGAIASSTQSAALGASGVGAAISGATTAGTGVIGVGAKVVLLAGLGFVGAGVAHRAVELATPAALSVLESSRVDPEGAEPPRGAEVSFTRRADLGSDATPNAQSAEQRGVATTKSEAAPPATSDSEQVPPRQSSSRPAVAPPRRISAQDEQQHKRPASTTSNHITPTSVEALIQAPPTASALAHGEAPEAAQQEPGESGLQAEVRRLSRAERSLADGRADEAVRLLSADSGEPDSSNALAIERRALQLVAGCQSQDPSTRREARHRAQAFERAHADSPLVNRVRSECKRRAR